MGLLSKISERIDSKEVRKYQKTAQKTLDLETAYAQLTDDELFAKTALFRERLASGESLESFMHEAFASVREAAWRVLGMKHFPVQIIGGLILHEGCIAEMKTGEGKTLAATLPAYANALLGNGVHVVTVNDYLAARDADWMGKIYRFLGMSVGLNIHGMSASEKREAYACDITYGTNNEFGFDYLRDNMAHSVEETVQRPLSYAIIDEVDSILIDDARTPLIISGSGQESTQMYARADQFARTLSAGPEGPDVKIDEKARTATLTEEGTARAEKAFRVDNLADLDNMELSHYINQALRANFIMKKDVDYVIYENNEIVIVDENTGRLMFGRRFNEGLHQAIEAKERVKVNRESVTMATITLQNYFRMYGKLAGMTGTAKTEENEFKSIYGMDVVSVPTNKPMIREDRNDVVYRTVKGKYEAVIRDIEERNAKGQPVLVGTISIEKSEQLSSMLRRRGIRHNVLNAKYHEKEAEIISMAGQRGAVTISTNMAGRGTDIVLGEGVAGIGGLHIIGTERHESRRIDNQLRGRAGRQGDMGSSQFFLSLEDDLLRLFGAERIAGIVDRLGMDDESPLEARMLSRTIENAQKNVEARNFATRKNVLRYDDVMNKQREVIYSQRREVLEGKDVSGIIKDYMRHSASTVAAQHTAYSEDGAAGTKEIEKYIRENYGIEMPIPQEAAGDAEKLEEVISAAFLGVHAKLESLITPEKMREAERHVLRSVVDSRWMEHIDAMEQLRQGVGLQAYAQSDPIQAYTREGLEMFDEMSESIMDDTTRFIMRVRPRESAEARTAKRQPVFTNEGRQPGPANNVRRAGQISKNQLCPCGSGKKYKRCCGKEVA